MTLEILLIKYFCTNMKNQLQKAIVNINIHQFSLLISQMNFSQTLKSRGITDVICFLETIN